MCPANGCRRTEPNRSPTSHRHTNSEPRTSSCRAHPIDEEGNWIMTDRRLQLVNRIEPSARPQHVAEHRVIIDNLDPSRPHGERLLYAVQDIAHGGGTEWAVQKIDRSLGIVRGRRILTT